MNILEYEKVLAKKLVNYSCDVKKGEKVIIDYSGCSRSFVDAIVEQVFEVGAYPLVVHIPQKVKKTILQNGDSDYFELLKKYDLQRMKECDAVILIKGEHNVFEFGDISQSQIDLYNKHYVKEIHLENRVTKKWVLLKYPTPAFAQACNMSTDKFIDFFFKVCTMDYTKMSNAMDGLKKLMEKTDKVRIVANDTDISFSIKGMNAIKCCGKANIPDGEIYTAPLKQSINGKIHFNVPAMYNGVKFENIILEFKDGKIVNASCNHTELFNQILDSDAGSRYMGEFAFGVNPYITYSINDILFDEKMCQSIHMAIGNSYDDAFNGNVSQIHWDLIQSHSLEFGGGEIYFDDVLIRKNGVFLLDQLIALNKENLL